MMTIIFVEFLCVILDSQQPLFVGFLRRTWATRFEIHTIRLFVFIDKGHVHIINTEHYTEHSNKRDLV